MARNWWPPTWFFFNSDLKKKWISAKRELIVNDFFSGRLDIFFLGKNVWKSLVLKRPSIKSFTTAALPLEHLCHSNGNKWNIGASKTRYNSVRLRSISANSFSLRRRVCVGVSARLNRARRAHRNEGAKKGDHWDTENRQSFIERLDAENRLSDKSKPTATNNNNNNNGDCSSSGGGGGGRQKKKRKKKEIKKKRGIAQKIRNSNLSDYSSGNDSYYWRHCFLLVSFFFVRLFRVSWPTSLLPSSLPFWPSSSSSLVSLWNRFSVLFVNVWVCVFFSLTKAFFIRLAGGQQKRRRKVASLNLHFHQPRFNAPFHGVIQIETRARWSPPTLPIDPWPLFMYRRVIRFVLLSSNGETRNRSSLAPLIIFDNRSNYGFFTVHLILKRDQFCYHSRWHPRQFEIS